MDQLETLERELVSTSQPVAIDTETNITDSYEERWCMGVSIAQGDNHWYIPVGHKPILGEPQQNIEKLPPEFFDALKDKTIVMHNAKFDLHVLRSLGWEGKYWNLYDTMLMSHSIDENSPNSLDFLSKQFSTVPKNSQLAKTLKLDWDNAFIFGMEKYAREDAIATLQVFAALDQYYEPYRAQWNEIDKYFLYCLLDIERKGIRLDKKECSRQEQLCRDRMVQIKKELGFDPAKPSELHPKLFDDPPFGYGLKPTSLTPKGKPKVDSKFLESTNHPVCGLVLEYRKLQKMASSYFANYLAIVGQGDRLHPTFKMHGTVTGRLSCEYPNLQQIPRESEVKKMFLPEEGYQLWEIDYRNLEMRMAAVYSQQPNLLEAFRNEEDVHQQVADRVGVTRQVAKIVNFLLIYGGGPEALSFQANISLKLAKDTFNAYRREYPELFSAMRQAEASAQSNGYVRLFNDRRRHFKYPSEYRKAFNAVIQGGSFELVKRAMLKLSAAGFDMRNQVHDSVWLNVSSESEVIEAERVMSEWTEQDFGLKFSVDRKRLR